MSRDSIKEATLELFQRYSYVKSSVSDIAAAAGIGKGTIYLSFKTKEEILFALLDDMIGAFQEQTIPRFRDKSVTLEEKVDLFARSLVDLTFRSAT